MVKSSSGKLNMRSFTVIDVRKANGSATKFPKKNPLRYINKTPAQAALKAGHYLCDRKEIRGRCVFIITVKETTQGSDGKELTYTFKRKLLDKPIELNGRTIKYAGRVYAEKDGKKLLNRKSNKSLGKMRKLSRRSNTVDDVKPKYKKSKNVNKSSKSKKSKNVNKSNKVKKTQKKSLFSKFFG